MAHYDDLFNEIADIVKSTWNCEAIAPGRVPKTIQNLSRCVIALDSCEREFAGRSVEQTWNWTIEAQFPLPNVAGVDPQRLVSTKAEQLIDALTPFSTSNTTIPSSPTPFAGIGYQPQVELWSPVMLDDEDNSVALTMSFKVRTTVWQ